VRWRRDGGTWGGGHLAGGSGRGEDVRERKLRLGRLQDGRDGLGKLPPKVARDGDDTRHALDGTNSSEDRVRPACDEARDIATNLTRDRTH